MVSRWPARPETLVRRFEEAVELRWRAGAMPPETWPEVEARYRIARANLLARIYPATEFQAVRRTK
jgi:hypothetical protein